ncbi:hypothetical protein PTSG_11777 [Salpingoeca rosetta]|uniref:Uncharacterized protein n=1 Tax=Salpingoeca rosetta (strain ATCC 50818 / BSB-021) TaxID=946362 RepID=F2TYT3_SALR5|nr:uncharacterized protein PTSG_11777 [Salpingoeca rosetta]EGD78757.1 hypothetical protein PTSG_11777 [Salpingoeca rosetta]|eukprot:XP_004997714.1 hypothetical protein PTSG_11777 [Salpingoeca rosetta]
MDWPVKTKAEKEAERRKKKEKKDVEVVTFDDPHKRIQESKAAKRAHKAKKTDEGPAEEVDASSSALRRLMVRTKLDIEKFNLANSWGKRRRKLQQALVEDLGGKKKKPNPMPLPKLQGMKKKALERHHRENQKRASAGLSAKSVPYNLRNQKQRAKAKNKKLAHVLQKNGWWKDSTKGF